MQDRGPESVTHQDPPVLTKTVHQGPILPDQEIKQLTRQIEQILDYVMTEELVHQDLLLRVHPNYLESARNLIHYMALRAIDLRPIQEELSMLSISSLGHSEGYTVTNLRKILQLLRMIEGAPIEHKEEHFQSPFNYYRSKRQLQRNTRNIFGKCTRDNCSQIMVTMSTEAAYDYELIKDLLQAGMNIARINTSHDDQHIWRKMIQNIRKGREVTGKPCLIYMDLAGPKLRTHRIDAVHVKKDKKNRRYISLHEGDLVKLVRNLPQVNLADSEFEYGPPHLTVTLPQIFQDVRIGEEISFDDGKIKGAIVDTQPDGFTVKVTRAGIKGSKLREDKGINLPDTALNLPSLTESDHRNIPFIAEHADIIGYSFVRAPGDMMALQKELENLGHEDLGIILKIETRESFKNLPRLLLTAMHSPKVGVMIARGDLAVEMGFERISEVQEEILWICEAAHIPGIWATQVLDKLAQQGVATRAEITDAAMAARAECVMLNKGPYIVKAVSTLDDIIKRMEKHQFKRKSNLRPLRVAKRFLNLNRLLEEKTESRKEATLLS